MAEAVRLASEGTAGRTFALIDGALLLNLPPSVQRHWNSLNNQSLLVGSSDDVAAVGPLLFAIDDKQFDQEFLSTLCDQKAGRVVGSVISSKRELTELGSVLARFVDVQLADGTEMLMRFFDPRILPFWFDLLVADHCEHIAAAVAQWHFWRHDFAVETKTFEVNAHEQHPRMLPMRLSIDAENALMESCFPFTLMERLRAEDSDGLNRVPMQYRYTFFRKQIEKAQAYGLDRQSDLEAYCGAALDFGASFDEDQRVHTALRSIKHGRTFDEVLNGLTKDDWQRVRDAH